MKSAFKVDDPQFFMLKIRENLNHFSIPTFSSLNFLAKITVESARYARFSVEFKVDY